MLDHHQTKKTAGVSLIKLPGSAYATPLLVAGAVRSKGVILLLVVVVNGDKVSFVLSSFAIISQRERKREGVGVVCFTFIVLHVLL